MLTSEHYWAGLGCIVAQPYDLEIGAGTMAPQTFPRVLGPEPWNVAYVQPSRRPADGRFGENPNRLFQHHQFQVVLKPSPKNVQQLYLDSIRAVGIDALLHDIRFVEDDWESPTLGAWGLGWQVWCEVWRLRSSHTFNSAAAMTANLSEDFRRQFEEFLKNRTGSNNQAALSDEQARKLTFTP